MIEIEMLILLGVTGIGILGVIYASLNNSTKFEHLTKNLCPKKTEEERQQEAEEQRKKVAEERRKKYEVK